MSSTTKSYVARFMSRRLGMERREALAVQKRDLKAQAKKAAADARKAAADARKAAAEATTERQLFFQDMLDRIIDGDREYDKTGAESIIVPTADFTHRCQIKADPTKDHFEVTLTNQEPKERSVYQTTHVGASYPPGKLTPQKLLDAEELNIWPMNTDNSMTIPVKLLHALKVLRFVEEHGSCE